MRTALAGMDKYAGLAAEALPENLTDKGIVGHVAQIDYHIGNIIEGDTSLSEQRLHVFQHPHGLPLHIAGI